MCKANSFAVCLLVAIFAIFPGTTAIAQSWKFVSIPDFMNVDLATLDGFPGYPDGGRDSTTPGFESTLAFYLDAIAAENPDFVLVAGDLVEGEWHQDTTGRNLFGTYNTYAERAVALDVAADLYYSRWKQRFASRSLLPVPAVGDHELGDNNWNAGGVRSSMVPDFKDAFARHFTRDASGQPLFGGTINGVPARPVGTPWSETAYAFVHNNMLIVSVDVFRQDNPNTTLDSRTGSVLATVDGGQLSWLDNLLAAARQDPAIEHIVVQGHSPVLTPVRVNGQASELYLRDFDGTTDEQLADKGRDTDFWQTLALHDVDFYLGGEVHANTLSISDGVIQFVGDGIPFRNGHYLVGTVNGTQIEIELKFADLFTGPERFWNTINDNRFESLSQGQWQRVATATFDRSGAVKSLSDVTGQLIPFGINDGSVMVDAAPQSDLPVHYRFEGTGAVSTNSGSSQLANDAVVYGNVTSVAGRFGDAVDLDGQTSSHLIGGLSPVMETDVRTTSAWINTGATGALRTIVSFGTNRPGGKWDMDLDGQGRLELGVGSGRTIGIGPQVNDQQWHLVTVVFPSSATLLSDALFYVDGEFVYQDATATDPIDTDTGGIFIGRTVHDTNPFEGAIDDLALWSSPLRSAEIKSLFDVGEHSSLQYDAGDFQQLRHLHEQQASHVQLDGRLWIYADSLTGPAGLTASSGQFELVLDDLTQTGVKTVSVLPPQSLTIVRGVLTAGTVSDVLASDNIDFTVQRNPGQVQGVIELETETLAGIESPSSFEFTIESAAFFRSTVIQSIDLYDFDAQQFVRVDSRNASRFGDQTVTGSGSGDLSRFVEDGTGRVRTRLLFDSPVNRQKFSTSIDMIKWSID
ncbi:MAG: LamG domain-containing protein [Planctomycetota bacterium]